MAGLLGVLFGRPWAVVVTTMETALVCIGFSGNDDWGGGGTNDSGLDAEETVKVLNDVVNVLEGNCRKASIPCCNTQAFAAVCLMFVKSSPLARDTNIAYLWGGALKSSRLSLFAEAE